MIKTITENLIEFKLIIFTFLILLGLLIFRKEFNKLLDWIVRFRKIAGAKGDYEVSAETESPGSISYSKVQDERDRSVENRPDIVEDKKSEQEGNWFSFFDNKEYDKAIKILEEDLTSEHDDEKRNDTIGLIGHVKFEKDNNEGVEYFENVLEKTHKNSNVFYWYALSYYWRDKYDQAINILKEAINYNPTAFFLHDLFADCLSNQSRNIEAIEILLERLKQYPETPTHYKKIALILSNMGKNELARDCCRLGFKHCPGDASLLDKYGSIVSDMDDYKEAMFVYLRLTLIKPESAKYWALLGNQYLNLSFNDLALEAYKKANELAQEREEWIISNIGNILKNRGFYTEGASYLKKGISIEPDSQYAHERLAQALKEANDEVEKRDILEKEVLKTVRVYRSSEDIISEVKNKSSQ